MLKPSEDITTLAGGATARCPTVFTADSKYFFSAVATHIKMFSVLTGQLVRTISSGPGTAHKGLVSQLRLNPKNRFQLFSASLDGTIKLGDISDGSLIKTWNLHQPITHFILQPDDPQVAYVAVLRSHLRIKDTKLKSSRGKGQVAQVKLRMGKSETTKLSTLLRIRDCVGLEVTSDVVVVASVSKFDVIKIENKEAFSFPSIQKISCIAVQPADNCLAVGHVNGEINLWYNLHRPANPDPVVTRLHWHAHRVHGLHFSPDGVYLLSGGEEAVLVIWQLATQHKQFLPRLGADVNAIGLSDDQSLYALTLGDNTIKIVSAVDLTVRQAVSGIKTVSVGNAARKAAGVNGRQSVWKSPARYRNAGVTVDPRSNLVVMAAASGTSVQFFNAPEDRHVMELETSPRNRVSRTENEEGDDVEVTKIAFSVDGEWMATVDITPSSDGQLDQSVNIWQFDPVHQSYIVNTRVSSPHDDLITSMSFSPVSSSSSSHDAPRLLLTTSLDAKFKTWQLHNATTTALPTTLTEISKTTTSTPEAFDAFWSQRSVGTHRSFPIHDAAFSHDGSVMALATGAVVTLWDPVSSILRATLAHPPANDPVLAVGFTGLARNQTDEASRIPFLASVTSTRLHVWNLLTCTVLVDPESECFAIGVVKTVKVAEEEKKEDEMEVEEEAKGVYDYSTEVMVFGPTSPAPRTLHRVEGIAQGMVFLPTVVAPKKATPSDRTVVLQALGDWNKLSETKAVEKKARKAAKTTEAKLTENRYKKSLGAVEGEGVEDETSQGLLDGDTPVASVVTPRTVGDVAGAASERKEREKGTLAFWEGPTWLIPEATVFAGVVLGEMLPRRKEIKAGKPLLIWRDAGADGEEMEVEEKEVKNEKIMLCFGEDEEVKVEELGELGGLVDVLKGIAVSERVAASAPAPKLVNGTPVKKAAVNGNGHAASKAVKADALNGVAEKVAFYNAKSIPASTEEPVKLKATPASTAASTPASGKRKKKKAV
ncbi:quinon protein alcohol dehydrogenase-like superfamily [Chytridium lagenaria]|nr:quinon protein alcohol dehydrogenase-like superfamily [Chytridium lagenaria]